MSAQTNQSVSFSSFVDYKKVVLTLVTDLEKLRDFSQKLKLDKSVALIDEVLKRIKADSFTVAVVGEFKRGKSTFINALLGKEILPSDILPCSATLNRVKYGMSPRVKVLFKDGHEEDIPIDKLNDYVAKLTPESEKTAKTVQEALVEYPVPYCQNNIEIIDTPGLNDDVNMTEVTLSVLPQVDAAILVIMAQAPFSEYERDFLENKLLTNDLGRVIFVVTGIDRFNRPEDADRLINSIKDRIRKYVLQRAESQHGKGSTEYQVYLKKIGEPKVFGLSGYQYLEGKQQNDSALIAQSRFSDFAVALEKFLTEDRGAILLQVPVNRAISSSMDILATITMQENALKMKQEDFEKAADNSMAEINNIRKRKKEEMKLIDKAAENVKYRIQPLIYQLPAELKRAAEKVIDETEIKDSDVKDRKAMAALAEKLGYKVSSAVQNASGKVSEKIQWEIQQGIDREVERLQDFVKSVDQALQHIQMEFKIKGNDARPQNATGEAITAALSVFTGLGGIWSGYRVAGVKGALAGAGASVLTAFATGIVAGIVGAPISLPVIIGMGVVSVFTSDWLAKMVFAKERAKSFKENYKKEVMEGIEQQFQEKFKQSIEQQISENFDQLKCTLQQEVESLLDDTQKTLDELRSQRERGKILSESECRDLAEIGKETQRILGNAERLSQQLVQIMSV
jgi:GTPase SAR1 family protein